MCGIAGYSGRKIPGLMSQMLDLIRHRGPDDDGRLDERDVHLGDYRSRL